MSYYKVQKRKRKREDVVIAKAVLAGCVPTYYDFGHPERARKYWSAPLLSRPGIAYGYTRADCCSCWLRWEFNGG